MPRREGRRTRLYKPTDNARARASGSPAREVPARQFDPL